MRFFYMQKIPASDTSIFVIYDCFDISDVLDNYSRMPIVMHNSSKLMRICKTPYGCCLNYSVIRSYKRRMRQRDNRLCRNRYTSYCIY